MTKKYKIPPLSNGIIRLGGVAMYYTQFEDRVAKCKNVYIANKLAIELTNEVKKITKAGIVKLVYMDIFSSQVLDIKTALQKFGYVVEDMAMDNDIQGEELLENSECVVLLGSSLVQIANGNKCIIVAENLDLFEIFHKQFGAVFVVMDMVNLSAFDIIANIYGKLMVKLLGCFDFKLSCICYNKNKDLQVIEEVENTIVELFSRHYIYYRDKDFIRDLTHCVINVGLLESMLTDMEILEGYNIPCLVVQKMAKSKKLVGEYAMLVGWFVVNTIKSLINVKDYDLFLPCDIMSDIDFVANKIGKNKMELLGITEKITAKEYTRLAFICREYSKEIEKYLDKIYPCCQNAMKNYRRIYYDAGLEVSASISLDNLSEGVLRSVAFNPKYSYIKTLRVMGAV